MVRLTPLTPSQRRGSLRNLYRHTTINGLAYMCVGEMVVALLAVKLGCSDGLVAALGTMLYVGFVMLPLGRMLAARVGAARAEGTFWFLRNLAALLIASSALWYPRHPALVAATILLGSFLFYGCRAAGIVLQQPLLGDISTSETRPRAIALSNGLFYVAMCASLAAVSAVLRCDESIRTIVWIIAVGSLLGMVSSAFLLLIDEGPGPRESARAPIRADARRLAASPRFRRFLTASVALNIAFMLLLPPSLLLLKRGHGVSDFDALLLTSPMWLMSALASFATAPLGRRYGPRKELLGTHLLFLALAALAALLAAPGTGVPRWSFLLFYAGFGLARGVLDNAVTHYYLASTPSRLRVPASLLLYLMYGVGAGLLGLGLSTGLLEWATHGGTATAVKGSAEALAAYRRYFWFLVALLAPTLTLVWRIAPLPEERRVRIRHAFRAPHHR